MTTNFPTSLDTFINPDAEVDDLESVPHDAQHADANDAIEALQVKVGITGSADSTSHTYKIAALEASAHYAHSQGIALSVWTVPHNLGRFPSVVVTDNLGQTIVPDVAYIDNNTVQITHGTPLAGFAYCN